MPEALIPVLMLAIGAAVGYLGFLRLERASAGSVRSHAERDLTDAKKEAQHILKEARVQAKEELLTKREALEAEAQEIRSEVKDRERRLGKREEVVDDKLGLVAKREGALAAVETRLLNRQKAIEATEVELNEVREKQLEELSRIARLKRDEATELLLKRLERAVEHEQGEIIMRTVKSAKEEADKKAREILTTAIQRVAADHAAEVTVSTIDLPTDELKGRIIGREGRNIRAFERATGADVIVDDTPGVIVLSGFDGVRRETARRAMEKLIADGRIHPTRIEEVVEETRKEMAQHIQETGKAAAMEVSVPNVHPKVIALLGRLRYRTSYGQNVLQHSIEVAELCGTLASELGLDIKLAKRCGLLHDVGKAVDHEIEGGHPEIGADLARRYEEAPEIVNAIAAHHNGCAQESLYAFVVMAGDAVSGGRPGARGESLERYIHRLAKLEEVAARFPGVKQAYAIQAGREIRVIVNANKVNDKHAAKLARDVAREIETELTYPGEIKVTLMRETRVIEYAR
ncbi:ribonuclease Y [Planctomycetota bacterium]